MVSTGPSTWIGRSLVLVGGARRARVSPADKRQRPLKYTKYGGTLRKMWALRASVKAVTMHTVPTSLPVPSILPVVVCPAEIALKGVGGDQIDTACVCS